ncbi:hypothetical protein BDV59DRAFT_175859 [Aspergillus ambiguus]|uniref:uncharacterized protein n=1 Tax=Aspergillus ambiguus TaxID=176160 RepID=UPI003CCDF36F
MPTSLLLLLLLLLKPKTFNPGNHHCHSSTSHYYRSFERPITLVLGLFLVNALLNMPSGYFLIETHREAPTESAATRASLFMSNLISRFRRFSASSTIKRPRVNLKNSS